MIKVNGEALKTETFPNGEIKISEFIVKNENNISFKFHSHVDFINLLMVKNHIDENNSRSKNYLCIDYFPYSRMDRKIKGDLFTLKGMCKFINKMNFDVVYTSDNHSNVTDALLDRNVNKSMIPLLLKEVEKEFNIDYILYPDLGALKRYRIDDYKSLVGEKVRNEQTGRIESYEIKSSISLKDMTILIIDDLSSFGGTFAHASDKLKKLGAEKIYLAVAHCENAILDGRLLKPINGRAIDKVFTTNSIIDKSKETEDLMIIDIFK